MQDDLSGQALLALAGPAGIEIEIESELGERL